MRLRLPQETVLLREQAIWDPEARPQLPSPPRLIGDMDLLVSEPSAGCSRAGHSCPPCSILPTYSCSGPCLKFCPAWSSLAFPWQNLLLPQGVPAALCSCLCYVAELCCPVLSRAPKPPDPVAAEHLNRGQSR